MAEMELTKPRVNSTTTKILPLVEGLSLGPKWRMIRLNNPHSGVHSEKMRALLLAQINSEIASQEGKDDLVNIALVGLSAPQDAIFPAGQPQELINIARETNHIATLLAQYQGQCLALIDGPISGPALSIALGCTRIIATRSSVFSFPEARFGLPPMAQGFGRLAQRIGIAEALETVFGAKNMSAQTANNIGLCDAIIPDLPQDFHDYPMGSKDIFAQYGEDHGTEIRREIPQRHAIQAALSQARKRISDENAPLQTALIDAQEAMLLLPEAAAQSLDLATFEDLATSDTVAALCHFKKSRDLMRMKIADFAAITPPKSLRLGISGNAAGLRFLATLALARGGKVFHEDLNFSHDTNYLRGDHPLNNVEFCSTARLHDQCDLIAIQNDPPAKTCACGHPIKLSVFDPSAAHNEAIDLTLAPKMKLVEVNATVRTNTAALATLLRLFHSCAIDVVFGSQTPNLGPMIFTRAAALNQFFRAEGWEQAQIDASLAGLYHRFGPAAPACYQSDAVQGFDMAKKASIRKRWLFGFADIVFDALENNYPAERIDVISVSGYGFQARSGGLAYQILHQNREDMAQCLANWQSDSALWRLPNSLRPQKFSAS